MKCNSRYRNCIMVIEPWIIAVESFKGIIEGGNLGVQKSSTCFPSLQQALGPGCPELALGRMLDTKSQLWKHALFAELPNVLLEMAQRCGNLSRTSRVQFPSAY